jgi:alpha-1,6-mannosyltransferase
MRLMALVGIALIFFAITRLAPLAGVDPAYGLWLGVLNPVVLVHLVGDAHNDALMIGLMMAGLTLAIERRPAAGSVLVTLGALIKAPAGLALIFIVSLWASQLSGRARYLRAILVTGGLSIITVVTTTALAGTGYGWIGALNTPTIAHTWTSLTTDLGYLTGLLVTRLGIASPAQATTFWHLIGYAVAAVLTVVMLRRYRTNPALGVGMSLAAVIFFGPVFHPWYMLWATVPLAAAATSPRARKLVIIAVLAMSSLVLPGGINPGLGAIAGGVVGVLLVVIVSWALRNLDRNDLVGSARVALRRLAPAELVRLARESWRVPDQPDGASTAPPGPVISGASTEAVGAR